MRGINIKVPKRVVEWFDKFSAWGDVLVWKVGPLNIRRIDFLIVLSGIVCAGYYWVTGGWLLALQGLALWVFVLMIVLWFF